MITNKSYYAIIPASVRYDKLIPNGAKLLYGEITSLCNEKGYCWANNQYFSELYDISDRTIRRWLNALQEQFYINTEITDNNSRKIFINERVDKIVLPPRTKMSYPPDKNVLHNTKENTKMNIMSKYTSDELIEIANTPWINKR